MTRAGPARKDGTAAAPPFEAHALADLGPLRRALAERRRAEAEAARLELERRAVEARERELFARSVGPVVPIHAAPVAHARVPPEPVPRQRERDEAAVMLEAISDEFDVETLLDTDEALSFRRSGIGVEVVRKLRRGVWAIQAQLDLHGLRREEARESLNRFVHQAGRDGLRCVRVVHGKGNGSPGREPVLKQKVKAWLVQKKEVVAFVQARGSEGGAGALVVLLETAPRPVRGARRAHPIRGSDEPG